MLVNAISCTDAQLAFAELRVEQAKDLSRKAKIDAVLKIAYTEIRTAISTHRHFIELPIIALREILNQNDWSGILLEVADILRLPGPGGGYVVDECKGKFLLCGDPPVFAGPVYSLKISGW